MNADQIAAECLRKLQDVTNADNKLAIIQAAIEKATEATAEEFRQGLYGKLDQAIKLVLAAHASEEHISKLDLKAWDGSGDPPLKPAHASEDWKDRMIAELNERNAKEVTEWKAAHASGQGHTITEVHEKIQSGMAAARLTPEYEQEGRELERGHTIHASDQGDLILEASELLDKHLHCNCKWDNGHEPTCAIVKARDWRKRALSQRPTPATNAVH